MAIGAAVIGCGLIGTRRAAQIASDPESALLYTVDSDWERAREAGGTPSTDWRAVIQQPEVDAVVVSTPNHLLAEIALAALAAGKHVLVEKPLGRNVEEAEALVAAAKRSGTILKTGFNHRFHPAIQEAKARLNAGEIGKLLTIRARYGHGGRRGMENEWRTSRELCGGGELLDQGVHLIDLIQWFAGPITEVKGMLDTQFWPIEVEDNAYVIARTTENVNALFHVSWTCWTNLFSFELYGTKGYMHVQGLGKSYGIETLEIGLRNEGAKPTVTRIEYHGEDPSWELEWRDFRDAIRYRREPLGNGLDGLSANRVVAAVIASQASIKLSDAE